MHDSKLHELSEEELEQLEQDTYEFEHWFLKRIKWLPDSTGDFRCPCHLERVPTRFNIDEW